MEDFVAQPHTPVTRLRLIDADERYRLLEGSVGRRMPDTSYVAVHKVFEKQADQTPSEIAVVLDGQEVTYAELNRRANSLSHLLRRVGAGPDKRVALFLERSVGQIVAVLGTWKAGAAYVPLDVDHPASRLAQVLDGARPTVIVTTQAMAARLPEVDPACCDGAP